MPRTPSRTPNKAAAAGKALERPGIVAVAREAGVSIATVSRVLNNQSTVQPKLARRVQEAIEKTGYLADTAARSLASGRSRLFGVIISNLTNPFFPELLQNFEDFAVNLGYEVLVASTAYDLQRMNLCIDRMLARKVDGVAVMTFGIEGPLLSRFVDRGVPLVFMDEAPPSQSSYAIKVDYQAGIQEAVEHLVDLGHRRIGCVVGPEQHISVLNRRRAMERCLQSAGLPQTPELTFSGDHSFESGEAALKHFLALKKPPTAILCSNDLSAIGVIHAAENAGVSIPADLSLIGFDGIALGAYIVPALTSVVMSRRDIAEAAVHTLWESVERREVAPVCIKTHLLVRSTTSKPPARLAPRKAQARGSN